MDSLQKVNQLLLGTSSIVPEGEEQARMVQALQVAGPFIGDFIPETAEELDELLLGVAKWCFDLRSDEAPPAPAIEALGSLYREVRRRSGMPAVDLAEEAS